MLIILQAGSTKEDVEQVVAELAGVSITGYPAHNQGREVVCLSQHLNMELRTWLHAVCPQVERVLDIKAPYKLASSEYKPAPSSVVVGAGSGQVRVGPGNFVVMAGPCTIESEEQLFKTAALVKQAGANILRGGAC